MRFEAPPPWSLMNAQASTREPGFQQMVPEEPFLPKGVLKILRISEEKWTHRFGSQRKRFIKRSEKLAKILHNNSFVENPDFYHQVDLETQLRIFKLLGLRITVAFEKGNFDKLQESKGYFDAQIRTMIRSWDGYKTFIKPEDKIAEVDEVKLNRKKIRKFINDDSDLHKSYRRMLFEDEFPYIKPD